ncbi:MAG: orotidine-5'-phosphate decarboxylase [Anaerolineaceae bacterium]|nr:orotidine-5'-phosphate decarboxylase [Anaerolineaceae bacterium]
MSFFKFLEDRARSINSLLCIGLDPHPQDLSELSAQAALDFCLPLIEATKDFAAAYKPNAAFFEALGPDGWQALKTVIDSIPDEIPVLLDAKRGDISSTAQAYASSAFENLEADAITLSPYLGQDSLEPFLKDPCKGAFLLCKTSNPGAGDLQDLIICEADGHVTLFEKVARLAQSWNRNDNLGVVVGATQPDALKKVRQTAPDIWILAPGVGAQGGDLQTALCAGLRADGMGMLVPVSRSIARAADPAKAAQKICQEIEEVRNQLMKSGKLEPVSVKLSWLEPLANGLLDAECVRFGEFTLKSGLKSPFYIDLRRLASFPKLLKIIAEAYLSILKDLQFNRIAALPYAAMPIGTAISLQGEVPMIYPRREAKDYGTRASIEGLYQPGETIAVIDDLTTTGESKFEVIKRLQDAGLIIKDVVVLIDRQSGASESLSEAGYNLHSVVTISQLLDHWEENTQVESKHIQAARAFLKN